MPPQNQADQAALDSGVSRRSMLRGAAGVSAVGLVAATGAGAAFAATRPAASARPATPAKPATLDATSVKADEEPLVVYLRDIKSGEFEVFNGTSQVRVRSPKLVAQLLNDLQTAQ